MEENFFDQPIKNDLKTYNIRKIATGQCDNYTTGCLLLDYPYFKKYDKLVTIDLNKQQKLDGDPKAIQQISFTDKVSRVESATTFFITEEAKETALNFLKGTVKLLWFYFVLIKYWYKMTHYNTLNVTLSIHNLIS